MATVGRILIVGGGIAGLTLGAALHQRGTHRAQRVVGGHRGSIARLSAFPKI
jgi:glycine/D-amino acid oxidase-like deaminating enzyme